MNSPHQMKQFDTKIPHFGVLNRCKRQVLSLLLKFNDPLLSSLDLEQKKKQK
jgi:hypothetical protein